MRPLGTLAVWAFSVALGACDFIGLGDNSNMTVSFAVPSSRVQLTIVAANVIIGGHTLDLQHVDATFSKIQLDRHADPVLGDDDVAAEDDVRDRGDEEEVKVGNTTVELPLTGNLITPLEVRVPPGDYESIEMKLVSVRLRGTYDGEAFDVTVPVHGEVETSFDPLFHLAPASDRLNITIQLDPSQWLRSNGSLIDPRPLANNQTLLTLVAHQIKASFHSFEDDDRHGDNDHAGT